MDGVGPLGTSRGLRGYGRKQQPYSGHPLLHPCEAGVLGFKASVPCARDPEAPAIQSQSPAPLSTQSPTHGASNVPPFPGPSPGPAQALSQPGCLVPFLSHHPGIPQGTAPLGLASPWVVLAHPYWAPTAHESSQLSADSRGESRWGQHTWRTGGVTPDHPRGGPNSRAFGPGKVGDGESL